MVGRDLSEAKPLWRPEGGIPQVATKEPCQRRSLSGGQRDGERANASPETSRVAKAYVGRRPAGWRRPLWREGGSDNRGKRVRGGERSERDGHRCEYRHHRRNLKTSPEARGLPQSEGH